MSNARSEYIPDPSEYDEVPEAKNGHETSEIELINAASFVNLDIPEPPQVICDLLHQGSKFSIGGASKACKTWALLDLAISVSLGLEWMGFSTTKGRVLYLNFEIQEFAWQKRLRIVSESRGVKDLTGIELVNLRGKANDFVTLLPRIRDRVRDEKFSLITIDPIYKLYGKTDENNARDVAALLTGIENLATETKAAVAYAAHFSKGNQSGKEAIDRVSGSGVFARDPDCMLVLTRHAKEDAFTVESILRNFPPIKPFVVQWAFPLLKRDPDLDPEDLKKPGGRPANYSDDDVLSLLDEKSLSTTDWFKAANTELGISRSNFFRLLKTIESDGHVLKSKINQKWAKIA